MARTWTSTDLSAPACPVGPGGRYVAQVLPLHPLRPWEPTPRALGAVEGWRPRSCVWPWAPGGIIPFEQNSQESEVGGEGSDGELSGGHANVGACGLFL